MPVRDERAGIYFLSYDSPNAYGAFPGSLKRWEQRLRVTLCVALFLCAASEKIKEGAC